MVSVRVRVKVRVINQSNKSAGNKNGMYAVLGAIKVDIHSTLTIGAFL